MELVILSESILYKKKYVHTLDWKMILSQMIKKRTPLFFLNLFDNLIGGVGMENGPT